MKAQFVYESISFERGRDPKAAMGIGMNGYWDILVNVHKLDPEEFIPISYEGKYKGWNIMVIKSTWRSKADPYIAVATMDGNSLYLEGGNWHDNTEDTIPDIKSVIDYEG